MSEMNGREIDRTASYMLLSRRRGTLLFRDLLRYRQTIEKLERRNDVLREELDAERNLLVLALHELALATGKKEPQLFIRHWQHDQRQTEKERPV